MKINHSYIINMLCKKKKKTKKEIFLKEMNLYYNDTEQVFDFMLKNTILDVEYLISCNSEDYIDYKVLGTRCDCGRKIEEHENKVNLYVIRDEFKQFYSEMNVKYTDQDPCWQNNKPILDEIRDEENLVPFIGSEVSIPFGFPSWSQLVDKYSESCSENAKLGIKYNKNLGNFIECFNIIIKDTQNQKIKNQSDLKQSISKDFSLNGVDLNVENNYIDILKYDLPLIFTTNYDEILDSLGNEKYESIIFQEIEEMMSIEREKIIVHLHGSSRRTSKRQMVITKEDYENLYQNEDYSRKLQSLLGNKSILFIGYSLDDYYFMNELMKICASNRNFGSYYAFMINVDFEKLEVKIPVYYKAIKIINIKGEDIIDKISFYLSYIQNKIYFN